MCIFHSNFWYLLIVLTKRLYLSMQDILINHFCLFLLFQRSGVAARWEGWCKSWPIGRSFYTPALLSYLRIWLSLTFPFKHILKQASPCCRKKYYRLFFCSLKGFANSSIFNIVLKAIWFNRIYLPILTW